MLQSYRDQYLARKGWLRSVEMRASVDADGLAVPWLTYPANAFLAGLVRPDLRVFEFGSGFSTVWWSRHGAKVHAVEHDAAWLDRIRPQCGDNANLRLQPGDAAYQSAQPGLIERYFEEVSEPPAPADQGFQFRAGLLSHSFRAYAAEILQFPAGHFDIVVIDGMARILTTWLTIQHARPRNFIVFDNSDREVYAPAYALLREAGYHRIDFWGSGPINPYEWCTSIFLRDINLLP